MKPCKSESSLPGDEDFLATGGGVFLLLGTGDFSLSDVSLFEEELWNTDDFSVVTASPTILRSGVLLLSLLKWDYYLNHNFNLISMFTHRGLKLDGAIGQGEICNSLKSENFSKSFPSHIGKNEIKF